MKPDWKDAPDWAMWLVMDTQGEWTWFEHEPILSQEGWWWCSVVGRYQEAGFYGAGAVIEKRP